MAKQQINKSRQRRKSSDRTQRLTLRLSIECMLETLMWLRDKEGFEVGKSILVDAAKYVRWFGDDCQCLDPWVGADLTTRIMTDVAAFDTFRRHLEKRPVVDAYVMARADQLRGCLSPHSDALSARHRFDGSSDERKSDRRKFLEWLPEALLFVRTRNPSSISEVARHVKVAASTLTRNDTFARSWEINRRGKPEGTSGTADDQRATKGWKRGSMPEPSAHILSKTQDRGSLNHLQRGSRSSEEEELHDAELDAEIDARNARRKAPTKKRL